MSVINLIESLEKDDRFSPSITEHRYIHPVEPLYKKIDLDEEIKRFLKIRALNCSGAIRLRRLI